MSVKHRDSVEKIIFTYFAAITKVPFVANGITVTPKPLLVSDSLPLGDTCHRNCGACCQKFTLDYIDGEVTPIGVHERFYVFNGEQVRIWTDPQRENRRGRCKYLSLVDAQCAIYPVRPFTCDFELIRVEIGSIRNYNTIGIEQFGRSWQLTRVGGEKGTCCEIKQARPESIDETVRKIERLRTWAEHFRLTETWTPEIVDYLRSGEWRNGPITLFPPGWEGQEETLYKRPTRHPGRELIKEMIAEGTHTRKEIMDALLAAYPEVPPSAFATHLTDAKNPKYNTFGQKVVIDTNGISKFEV